MYFLPSVTLNHALQISCSTDIWTIQRMDLWRLVKHINTASMLANSQSHFLGPKNHPVRPPCAERGRHHQLLLCETQAKAIEQCMLGKRLQCQSMSKARASISSKGWRKKRCVYKARQRECRGTALLGFGIDQYRLLINLSCSFHLSFARLDVSQKKSFKFSLGALTNYELCRRAAS